MGHRVPYSGPWLQASSPQPQTIGHPTPHPCPVLTPPPPTRPTEHLTPLYTHTLALGSSPPQPSWCPGCPCPETGPFCPLQDSVQPEGPDWPPMTPSLSPLQTWGPCGAGGHSGPEQPSCGVSQTQIPSLSLLWSGALCLRGSAASVHTPPTS